MGLLTLALSFGSITAPAVVAQESPAADGVDAETRALLDQALSPPGLELTGTLVVVAFDDDGPSVSEFEVRGEAGGDLVATTSGRWSFTNDGRDAFVRAGGGPPLRLGALVDGVTTVEALLANYRVSIGESRTLDTGDAIALDLFSQSDGVQRERMWVDRSLGTIVRRETYGRDGKPRRLIALTRIDVITRHSARAIPTDAPSQGELVDLDEEAPDILSRTGWSAPRVLPDGFRLRDAFVMGDATTSALHLVYSDGLYTVSVYEQPGRLAADGRAGAVRTGNAVMPVWRWPGAEPERMVWTSGSMTFAAITDAPHDVVLPVLAALPHDEPASFAGRIRHGLGRVMSWLNPFA